MTTPTRAPQNPHRCSNPHSAVRRPASPSAIPAPVPIRRSAAASPAPRRRGVFGVPVRPEPWTVRLHLGVERFVSARLWVAEIVGLDDDYLFARRFDAGRVFSAPGEAGGTDVLVRLARREGLFELGWCGADGVVRRRYCYVGGGTRLELDEDAAFEIAELLDAARRTGAGRRPAIGAGRRPAIGAGRRPAIGAGRRPAIGAERRPAAGPVAVPRHGAAA